MNETYKRVLIWLVAGMFCAVAWTAFIYGLYSISEALR